MTITIKCPGGYDVLQLSVLSIIIVPLMGLTPFHLVWMIPVSFFIGYYSYIFPLSLLNIPGVLFARLVCVGIEYDEIFKEAIVKNVMEEITESYLRASKLEDTNRNKENKEHERLKQIESDYLERERKQRRKEIDTIREEIQDWNPKPGWNEKTDTKGLLLINKTDKDLNEIKELTILKTYREKKLREKEQLEKSLRERNNPRLLEVLTQYRNDKRTLYYRSDLNKDEKKLISDKLLVLENHLYKCVFCGTKDIEKLEVVFIPTRRSILSLEAKDFIRIEDLNRSVPPIMLYPVCQECLNGGFTREHFEQWEKSMIEFNYGGIYLKHDIYESAEDYVLGKKRKI